MAENIKRHVTHIKSKVVEEGLPKLPTAAQLQDGEIAVNYAKGYETLSIKNESGDVVTFSSDNYYSEKKLGSGFTGANSAKTVTEALENIEIDVDQVLDDTTSASTNAVSSKAAYKAMTDNELVWTNAYVRLSGVVSSHTSTTAIHMDATEKENLDSLATNIGTISGITSTDVTSWNNAATNSHTHTNKSALDSITGSVGTMAYQNTSTYSSATEVNTALSGKSDTGHTHAISDVTDLQTTLNGKADTTAVTQSINAATSGKVDTSTYETYTATTDTLIGGKFGGANYDSNTKRINFYTSSSKTGTVIDYIDATAFVKDGMVSNVEISGGSLVITFNEDSGKQTISIPLTDIFNPNNYYTKSETSGKTEIANLVGSGFTSSTITDVIVENELIVSKAITDLSTDKADKDHTHAISAVTGLQAALDGKSNTGHTHSGYVPTGRTITAGTGLSGGGNLSANRTINLAMPTTYSAGTYTSVVITSSEPIVYALVKASSNLTNQVCPVSLVDGQQCDVIYMGSTTAATYTVTISTNYTTPTGAAIPAITVPANGYVEINYINIKGVIFVRGV